MPLATDARRAARDADGGAGKARAAGEGAEEPAQAFVPRVGVRKDLTAAERQKLADHKAATSGPNAEPDDNLLPPLQLWKFVRVSTVLILAVAAGKALGVEGYFEEWRKQKRSEMRERDTRELARGTELRDRDPKSVAIQLGSALVFGATVGLSGGWYFTNVYKPRRHAAVLKTLEYLEQKLGPPELRPSGRVRGTFGDNSASFKFDTKIAKREEVNVSTQAVRDTMQDVWRIAKLDIVRIKTGAPISLGEARALRETS